MHSFSHEISPLQICYRYATIKEDDSISKDITICAGRSPGGGATAAAPESHVFLSASEKVSIVLYTTNDPEEQFHFALRYQGEVGRSRGGSCGRSRVSPGVGSWGGSVGEFGAGSIIFSH